MAQLVKICLQCGRPEFTPGLGISSEEGKGYPLQYSGPENSMDSIVRGVANNGTRLNDFHSPGMPCRTASPHPHLDEVNQSWSAFQGSWWCDSVGAVCGTLAGPDWRVASKGKRGPLEKPLDRWECFASAPGMEM